MLYERYEISARAHEYAFHFHRRNHARKFPYRQPRYVRKRVDVRLARAFESRVNLFLVVRQLCRFLFALRAFLENGRIAELFENIARVFGEIRAVFNQRVAPAPRRRFGRIGEGKQRFFRVF